MNSDGYNDLYTSKDEYSRSCIWCDSLMVSGMDNDVGKLYRGCDIEP